MHNPITGPKPLPDLVKAMVAGVPDLPPGRTSLSVLGSTYMMQTLAAITPGRKARDPRRTPLTAGASGTRTRT